MGLWYVLACVVVPCFIGAVMFVGFEAWERRRRGKGGQDGLPAIDYSI